jgi:UDP-N-acetylmuramoyl-L-alanyl-D-glutamate--2,6-diaminopimelate ligase
MTLGEALKGVRVLSGIPDELAARTVRGIEYDSRRVGTDFLFAAFTGARLDGNRFAQDALARGALAVMSESPKPDWFSRPWIQVEHGRRALAVVSKNFYGAPDERLFFTGITGTNGKTTTSYLLEAILKSAGYITGLIGTVEYHLVGEILPAPNTTPESLDIMRFSAELERRGGTHLVSEVSSHALELGRVWGFRFFTTVFTNLTRDHLDFHGDMPGYRSAKRRLFLPVEGPRPRWAVLNADDPESKGMEPGPETQVIWYGTSSSAGLRAENVRQGFEGSRFELVWEGKRQEVSSKLVGSFNVSNILAAAGAALSHGVSLEGIARGIEACPSVPGRFESIDQGQPYLVVVDYAHTDDALRNVLTTARAMTRGRVITLFGCGGDRDRTKRPLMGAAAAELSDYVVLTSDNPRSEDPLAIMNDALVGIGRFDTQYVAEPDRRLAIRLALAEARTGDVVVLAGKGHETTQVLKEGTIAFDDRVVAREVLQRLGYDKPGYEK